MKKLIVNADDFGLTANVNQAILDAHCRGVISSTSLLANGEAFKSAVALSCQAPRLGVGVHLNLTEGKPLAASSAIPSLVDHQGFFARRAGGLWRAVLLGQARTAEIEKEFRAQIERVMVAGIEPTHLDSHKHVHALPALGTMAIRLASQYDIPAVRSVVERRPAFLYLMRRYPRATPTVCRQVANSFVLGIASRRWLGQLRNTGVASASQLYGVTATGFLDEDLLRHILAHLPEGTSELMCHPGMVDNALKRTGTRLLEQREMEYRALVQPGIKRLLQDLSIQLINYRDVVCSQTAEANLKGGVNPN